MYPATQKRSAVAYCGGPVGAVAQLELFDEGDESGAVKFKRTIPLAGSMVDTFSPQESVVSGTIDYRIQGLETVKITGFIRISPFRKLCTLARALL